MNNDQEEYFYVIDNGMPFEFLSDSNLRIVKGRRYVAITNLENTKNYPNLCFDELTTDQKIEWDLLGFEDNLDTPSF